MVQSLDRSKRVKQPEAGLPSSPAFTNFQNANIVGKGITMSRRQDVISLLAARTSATRERLEWMSTEELEEALSKNLLERREAQNNPEIIAAKAAAQRRVDAIHAERD